MSTTRNKVRLGLRWFCVTLPAALAVGCASIHSKSISDVAKGGGHRIVAADSGYGYLHVSVPELDAIAKLRTQCQNGAITGIETTLTSRDFLVVQVFEEKAEGWCQ